MQRRTQPPSFGSILMAGVFLPITGFVANPLLGTVAIALSCLIAAVLTAAFGFPPHLSLAAIWAVSTFAFWIRSWVRVRSASSATPSTDP